MRQQPLRCQRRDHMIAERFYAIDGQIPVEGADFAAERRTELLRRQRGPKVQHGGSLVILQQWQIEHRPGRLEEVTPFDIARDPDDFHRAAPERQSLSQRIFVKPHQPRQRLIEDRHRRRVVIVLARKTTTPDHRDAHRLEVTRRDNVLKSLEACRIAVATDGILPSRVVERERDGERGGLDPSRSFHAHQQLLLKGAAAIVRVTLFRKVDAGCQHLRGLITQVDGFSVL